MRTTGGKTLVVYYSASGNTQARLAEPTSPRPSGGDLFEVVPAEAYTGRGPELERTPTAASVREHDNPDVPAGRGP